MFNNNKRHWAYLKYILRHKYYVFVEGRKLHVPLYLLILHDWSKFLPSEWLPYARTFYKPDGTNQYDETVEFARAWMFHQHRNKHHWQYWLWVTVPSHNCSIPLRELSYLVWDRGETQLVVERNSGSEKWLELRPKHKEDEIDASAMPLTHCLEMLADWKGAGKAITGKDNTDEWYLKNKDKMILHPETRAWVEEQLGVKDA